MPGNNGAVLLGREMRIRLDAAHRKSLEGLTQVHGWSSETACAEALLADAIERAATNTARRHVVSVVFSALACARPG